jgi:hypothetical protein
MYNAKYVLMAGTSPVYFSDSKEKLMEVMRMYPKRVENKMRIVHVKEPNIKFNANKREYVRK